MGSSPPLQSAPANWRLQAAAGLLLAGLAMFAYLPAMQADFIWDDNLLLTDYPPMHAEDGLERFWTTLEAPDYYPLTWSSLWIEWRLWGRDATGYHVTNVVMHVIGALLLWRVLRQLRIPGAWLAATVFAIHPVTLASVGWISERKNVLSIIFYLLTILLFLHAATGRGRRRWVFYGLSLLAYILGLLSKTSIVPLPIVLVLCLWWLDDKSLLGRPAPPTLASWSWPIDKIAATVVPFVALTAAGCVMTVYTQYNTVIGKTDVYEPGENFAWRLALAGMSPWFYLWKLLVPQPLLMIYPRWRIDPSAVKFYLPGVALVAGVVALAWLTWRGRRWAKACLIAALYYVALLGPVLGLGKMYYHIHSLVADHLVYLAMIGPIVLIVGAAAAMVRRWELTGRRAGAISAIVLLAALVGKTWVQGTYYKDQVTLWPYNLKYNPDAWMALYNMGTCVATQANDMPDPARRRALLEEALPYFERSIKIRPQYDDTYNNYGLTLMNLGRLEEAKVWLTKGIQKTPQGNPFAYRNLALVLIQQGRPAEAEQVLRTGLAAAPYYAELKLDLGSILGDQGKTPEAMRLLDEMIQEYPQHVRALLKRAILYRGTGRGDLAEKDVRQALAVPTQDIPQVRFELAGALESQGKHAEALQEYVRVLGAWPGNAIVHFRCGLMLARLGRGREAIQHYVNAVGIQPDLVEAHGNLALLLAQQGFLADARKHYEQALSLKPDWVELMTDYARLLVSSDDPAVRDVPKALDLANQACALSGSRPQCLEVLAMVQAEAGMFDQAQASGIRAMELCVKAGDMESATRIDKLVQLFKAGQTLRQAKKAQVQ